MCLSKYIFVNIEIYVLTILPNNLAKPIDLLIYYLYVLFQIWR